MSTSRPPFIIGIAGASGSGKTTLSEKILQEIGPDNIALLPHDAYYRNQDAKPFEERLKVNYDHPSSLETELLIEHLRQLKAGHAVEVPVYDFVNHTRAKQTRLVEPKQLVMVEGILIYVEKKLRQLFDMKLFVDTDQDICFIRRLKRDLVERGRTMDSVVNQYLEMVRPSYLEFVEPTKRYADVIIPEGGLNLVASEMVIARLNSLIDG
ncbi:MAG: uridine kinase [Anaerolineaceae bacterium]|nr:uridine kinase [Anaerolineaceae bacterium]MDD4042303.1 uridine kinase [Anaerolineaceae bacterium]MDD4578288.1 uridine kinase [Anaerolineaceae bacterium]